MQTVGVLGLPRGLDIEAARTNVLAQLERLVPGFPETATKTRSKGKQRATETGEAAAQPAANDNSGGETSAYPRTTLQLSRSLKQTWPNSVKHFQSLHDAWIRHPDGRLKHGENLAAKDEKTQLLIDLAALCRANPGLPLEEDGEAFPDAYRHAFPGVWGVDFEVIVKHDGVTLTNVWLSAFEEKRYPIRELVKTSTNLWRILREKATIDGALRPDRESLWSQWNAQRKSGAHIDSYDPIVTHLKNQASVRHQSDIPKIDGNLSYEIARRCPQANGEAYPVEYFNNGILPGLHRYIFDVPEWNIKSLDVVILHEENTAVALKLWLLGAGDRQNDSGTVRRSICQLFRGTYSEDFMESLANPSKLIANHAICNVFENVMQSSPLIKTLVAQWKQQSGESEKQEKSVWNFINALAGLCHPKEGRPVKVKVDDREEMTAPDLYAYTHSEWGYTFELLVRHDGRRLQNIRFLSIQAQRTNREETLFTPEEAIKSMRDSNKEWASQPEKQAISRGVQNRHPKIDAPHGFSTNNTGLDKLVASFRAHPVDGQYDNFWAPLHWIKVELALISEEEKETRRPVKDENGDVVPNVYEYDVARWGERFHFYVKYDGERIDSGRLGEQVYIGSDRREKYTIAQPKSRARILDGLIYDDSPKEAMRRARKRIAQDRAAEQHPPRRRRTTQDGSPDTEEPGAVAAVSQPGASDDGAADEPASAGALTPHRESLESQWASQKQFGAFEPIVTVLEALRRPAAGGRRSGLPKIDKNLLGEIAKRCPGAEGQAYPVEFFNNGVLPRLYRYRFAVPEWETSLDVVAHLEENRGVVRYLWPLRAGDHSNDPEKVKRLILRSFEAHGPDFTRSLTNPSKLMIESGSCIPLFRKMNSPLIQKLAKQWKQSIGGSKELDKINKAKFHFLAAVAGLCHPKKGDPVEIDAMTAPDLYAYSLSAWGSAFDILVRHDGRTLQGIRFLKIQALGKNDEKELCSREKAIASMRQALSQEWGSQAERPAALREAQRRHPKLMSTDAHRYVDAIFEPLMNCFRAHKVSGQYPNFYAPLHWIKVVIAGLCEEPDIKKQRTAVTNDNGDVVPNVYEYDVKRWGQRFHFYAKYDGEGIETIRLGEEVWLGVNQPQYTIADLKKSRAQILSVLDRRVSDDVPEQRPARPQKRRRQKDDSDSAASSGDEGALPDETNQREVDDQASDKRTPARRRKRAAANDESKATQQPPRKKRAAGKKDSNIETPGDATAVSQPSVSEDLAAEAPAIGDPPSTAANEPAPPTTDSPGAPSAELAMFGQTEMEKRLAGLNLEFYYLSGGKITGKGPILPCGLVASILLLPRLQAAARADDETFNTEMTAFADTINAMAQQCDAETKQGLIGNQRKTDIAWELTKNGVGRFFLTDAWAKFDDMHARLLSHRLRNNADALQEALATSHQAGERILLLTLRAVGARLKGVQNNDIGISKEHFVVFVPERKDGADEPTQWRLYDPIKQDDLLNDPDHIDRHRPLVTQEALLALGKSAHHLWSARRQRGRQSVVIDIEKRILAPAPPPSGAEIVPIRDDSPPPTNRRPDKRSPFVDKLLEAQRLTTRQVEELDRLYPHPPGWTLVASEQQAPVPLKDTPFAAIKAPHVTDAGELSFCVALPAASNENRHHPQRLVLIGPPETPPDLQEAIRQAIANKQALPTFTPDLTEQQEYLQPQRSVRRPLPTPSLPEAPRAKRRKRGL